MNLKNYFVLLMLCLATTGYGQKKKVAVVTFYSDKMVGFTALELGSEELLKDLLNLRDNPNFNLAPLLDKFHTQFFNEYAKSFPFELLPETQVVDSEKYKSFVPKYEMSAYDANNYLNYGNYKNIHEGMFGKYNEEGMAKLFADEADGVMFVHISFDFAKGFGMGSTMTLKMRANARVALYNKKGEKVFAFTEGENSKKTGIMVKGLPVIRPEKILPMCESALEELMGDLDKRIKKIVVKTEAKL